MKTRFYTAQDVADILGVSRAKGYKVVQALNEELKADGYITVAGKIPIAFFNVKCYGGAAANDE